MLRPIDLFDDIVAERVVTIQRESYRIEADLIGFEQIPPLHESVSDVRGLNLRWMGSWVDELLVGLIAWSETVEICEIDRLAVHPEYFRRGHGRALLEPLTVHNTVEVSTGTKNIPALRLYESLGFVAVDYFEIAPAVTMTKLRRSR